MNFYEVGDFAPGTIFERVRSGRVDVVRPLFGFARSSGTVSNAITVVEPPLLLLARNGQPWKPEWQELARQFSSAARWFVARNASGAPELLDEAERAKMGSNPCSSPDRSDYAECLKKILKPGDPVIAVKKYENVPKGTTGVYYGTTPGDPPAFVVWNGIKPSGCFEAGLNGAPEADDGRGYCVHFDVIEPLAYR